VSLDESPHARGGSDERQRGAGAPPSQNTNALFESQITHAKKALVNSPPVSKQGPTEAVGREGGTLHNANAP